MDRILVQHIVKPHAVFATVIQDKTCKFAKKIVDTGKIAKSRAATFVGVRDGDTVRVGWSVVKFHVGDKFNAETGIAFAMQRALIPEDIPDKVDHKYGLRRDFQIFKKRCSKFFKGCHVMGYDPALDVVDVEAVDPVNDKAAKEKTLRDALRAILPDNSKHLADGPILGIGGDFAMPIGLGNVKGIQGDVLNLANIVGSLLTPDNIEEAKRFMRDVKAEFKKMKDDAKRMEVLRHEQSLQEG